MSKTYRAEFFTRADWAFWNFAAKTPAEALRLARRFYDEHLIDLDFQSYGDGDELERVQIWAGERGVLAAWESEDYRLRLAAGDLLAALEAETGAAQAVIDNWQQGDLASAVRALAAATKTARKVIATATRD